MDTTANAVGARDSAKLYPEYPEYPRNALNTKNAGNNSQTVLAARLAPYYKGQNVELVAKSLAVAINESQQTVTGVTGLLQYEQGELFPDGIPDLPRGYPSEVSQ